MEWGWLSELLKEGFPLIFYVSVLLPVAVMAHLLGLAMVASSLTSSRDSSTWLITLWQIGGTIVSTYVQGRRDEREASRADLSVVLAKSARRGNVSHSRPKVTLVNPSDNSEYDVSNLTSEQLMYIQHVWSNGKWLPDRVSELRPRTQRKWKEARGSPLL
jgi:hypothetical protein